MKKLLCTILAAAMLSPCAAYAREWVHVSEWAYNDVSVFTSEGLLTERFDSISDYRRNITRAEFAELLCSVLIKTGNITVYYRGTQPEDYSRFADVRYNEYIEHLASYSIIRGDQAASADENGTTAYFYPDNELTREDAAVMIYRAAGIFLPYACSDNTANPDFSDSADISDYAYSAVSLLSDMGVLSGTQDGSFLPKNNITIEQAITALYKFYRLLPTAPEADGVHIDATEETTIQAYPNGCIETKLNNTLYIKNDSGLSMPFDTDIYSNIYCSTGEDSNIYISAQTYNGTTDVFELASGRLLFTIPYPTDYTDEKYIRIKSSNTGPYTFGLWSYDNHEILSPEYSLQELNDILSNNMQEPEYEYRAPDGWIYYADWNDGGHLYKVDTNGENKQKLSDNDCFGITYIDGYLYYSIRGEYENCLYTIKADGTEEQRVTDNTAVLASDCVCISEGKNEYNTDAVPYANGYVFYLTDNENEPSTRSKALYKLWRENGEVKTEKLFDNVFSIGSFGLRVGYSSAPQIYGNYLYFTDYDNDSPYSSSLFRTDGNTVEEIYSGKDVYSYSFSDGSIILTTTGNTTYISDTDNIEFKPFEIRENEENTNSTIELTENGSKYYYTQYSSESFSIYAHYFTDTPSMNKLCYEDKDKNSVCLVEGDFIIIGKFGNKFFYGNSSADNMPSNTNNKNVYSFNTDTGEIKPELIDIPMLSMSASGDSWFEYSDNNSLIWRYNVDTGEHEQIYPSAGLNRYGQVESISYFKNKIYKTDTDGNRTDIADGSPHYMVYVKNGDVTEYNLYLKMQTYYGELDISSYAEKIIND